MPGVTTRERSDCLTMMLFLMPPYIGVWMRKSLRFHLLAVLGSATGCASLATQGPVYDFPLAQVERPAKTTQRYGPQVITVRNDSTVTRYNFEDHLVKMTLFATTDRVYFDLQNKTDNSIKIVWDEAAFVNPAGKSGAVMHNGMKYTDCSSRKAPTVVVKRGSVDDEVIPCESVHMGYSTWAIDPYLPTTRMTAGTQETVLGSIRQKVVGKKVSILLPLQIEDTVNEYLFTFEVKGVSAGATPRTPRDTTTAYPNAGP